MPPLIAAKPSILYIRHKRLAKISDLFRLNQDEWVEAVSELADVTLMTEDFDMAEACNRINPDFIIYESPPIHAAPLNITNPLSHPHIPRIGFMMQDPHCSSRVHFLRLAYDLKIKWLFNHMTEASLRQSPELKYNLFSTSLLFDDKVFRDYGLNKDIPVSVFGGFLAPEIYAWRAQTAKALPYCIPTFIYTHPGYLQPTPRHKFAVIGEDYARLLNQSAFSLADTTHLDCLVRKHLEIPACGAVLVAPDADVLKAYGFRDMENCILGEGDALLDKIATAADNPDLYEKIRKNGYDLVHGKYTRKHWNWFRDFYECLRTLQQGQTIRQKGMLGAFEAVDDTNPNAPAIAAEYPDSVVSAQMNSWLRRILSNEELDSISDEILKIPDWLFHMTEEWVLLGLIALLKGDIPHATEFFTAGQTLRKRLTGFSDYDPEEIAWLSLTAAISGNAALFETAKKEAATMQHLSLRRVQWLGAILATGGNASTPPPEVLTRNENDMISIHHTGQLDIKDWLELAKRVLQANGVASSL